MFLSIYPKRTKLISIDSKLYMLAKRKTVFFFSPVLLLWLESFCYLCTWSPPQSDFFVFFVTILLPTISNRWAFTLIIRAILCCMYNMLQDIFLQRNPYMHLPLQRKQHDRHSRLNGKVVLRQLFHRLQRRSVDVIR